MLIDFSVANFRSFRERQTLSFVAASRLPRKENTFQPDVEGESLPDLLKVAVVYGPNASGKSNLLRALDALKDIVDLAPSAKAQKLPVAPFRFDPELLHKPSEFEVNFIAGRRRFRLTLGATQDRIVHERLVEFPKGRESLLYERLYEDGAEGYTFGEDLEGEESVHETWRLLTSPQRMFLAQAVANSSEQLQQLRPPLAWLSRNLRTVPARMPAETLVKVTQVLAEEPGFPTEDLVTFIRDLDIPVTAVKFDQIDKRRPDEDIDSFTERLRAHLSSAAKVKAVLTHNSALGDAIFDFEEESGGTQNLLGFFFLWWSLRNMQPEPSLMAIDEFDSSLHPQIVASLVKKHIELGLPKQLLFTTHDTHLMDTKILRRDQIWLTERDINGATQLRAVHDFEGRESEDIEKRYYEGRYRGLPILRES